MKRFLIAVGIGAFVVATYGLIGWIIMKSLRHAAVSIDAVPEIRDAITIAWALVCVTGGVLIGMRRAEFMAKVDVAVKKGKTFGHFERWADQRDARLAQ